MSNETSFLKSLTKSNFQRPKTTYTDTLQNKKAMEEKLKNYERVDDIDDVPLNTHVRYVTLDKDKKQVFRLGGLLKKIHSKYVQLSNGSYIWSVQKYHYSDDPNEEEPIYETIFFRIISRNRQIQNQKKEMEDQKKEMENKQQKLIDIINKQSKEIEQLKKLIKQNR